MTASILGYMSRAIGAPLLMPLPPSGGDLAAEQERLQARGWEVENGHVKIPMLENQLDPKFMAFMKSKLGHDFSSWASQAADAVFSQFVAREYEVLTGKWNDKQKELSAIIDSASREGNYLNIPSQLTDSFDKFVEDYRKERGSTSMRIVNKQIEQYRSYVVAEGATAITTGAKMSAAASLENIKDDKRNKIQLNPSTLKTILDQLSSQKDLFYAGNSTPADAARDYERTVKDYIAGALTMQGLSDPIGAMEMLDSARSYMSVSDYAQYKKTISGLIRQAEKRAQVALDIDDAKAHVFSEAFRDGMVLPDAKLRKSADIMEANWEPDPDSPLQKDDIYIKIGYVPELYQSKLANGMIYGDAATRMTAALSIIRLDANMPWGSKSLPDDLVSYATVYSEIARLDSEKLGPLQEQYSKWINATAEERKAIADGSRRWLEAPDKKGKTPLDDMRASVFSKEGWWESSYDESTFNDELSLALQYRFNNDARRMMQSYVGIGIDNNAAKTYITNRISKEWGMSKAAGTDAYPAYKPIEMLFNVEKKNAKIFRSAMKQYISSQPLLPNRKPPNMSDIRLVWNSDVGERDAIYDVLERDKNLDIWLPYIYRDPKGGDMPLKINTRDLWGKAGFSSAQNQAPIPTAQLQAQQGAQS
jgi:hypothetical protein